MILTCKYLEAFLCRQTKVMQAGHESTFFPSVIASRDEKGSFQVSSPPQQSPQNSSCKIL